MDIPPSRTHKSKSTTAGLTPKLEAAAPTK